VRIEADGDVCIAAGQCFVTAPGVFDLDEDDGTVVVLVAEPDGADADAARQAVAACPSGALRLAD
jgi:ferredoxin